MLRFIKFFREKSQRKFLDKLSDSLKKAPKKATKEIIRKMRECIQENNEIEITKLEIYVLSNFNLIRMMQVTNLYQKKILLKSKNLQIEGKTLCATLGEETPAWVIILNGMDLIVLVS